ncbi:MAG: hypothetical protein FJW40_11500 [Acidobacteria bacterium]|nr:hypothetical protein [Acidobacteriota bacterium]
MWRALIVLPATPEDRENQTNQNVRCAGMRLPPAITMFDPPLLVLTVTVTPSCSIASGVFPRSRIAAPRRLRPLRKVHVDTRPDHLADPSATAEVGKGHELSVAVVPSKRIQHLDFSCLVDVDTAVATRHSFRCGHERGTDLEMKPQAREPAFRLRSNVKQAVFHDFALDPFADTGSIK